MNKVQYNRVLRFLEKMLIELGLDLNDPNLKGTPERMTHMFLNEFCSSVGQILPDNCKTVFPNINHYDEIVMSDKIHFTSLCSHHFLPFTGKAWVMYIPDRSLIGISKLSRIVEFYSKKPQLQEHLCQEIIDTVERLLKPKGSMVVMRAIHSCMSCRGVKQYGGGGMITSAVRGVFKESPATRQEGMELIKLSLSVE